MRRESRGYAGESAGEEYKPEIAEDLFPNTQAYFFAESLFACATPRTVAPTFPSFLKMFSSAVPKFG